MKQKILHGKLKLASLDSEYSGEKTLVLEGSVKKWGLKDTFTRPLKDLIPDELLNKRVSVTIRLLKQPEGP